LSTKRKKKQPIIFNDIEFDSPEELEFYHWLVEAKDNRIIHEFNTSPDTYLLTPDVRIECVKYLKTKTKDVIRQLLKPHYYTPDFEFTVTDPRVPYFLNVYASTTGSETIRYIVDVKNSTYSIYNNHREFSINQKLMFMKHGIYIPVIDPRKIFKATFVPEEIRYYKNRKVKTERKPFKGMYGVNDFLNQLAKFNGLGLNPSGYVIIPTE